MNFKLITVNCIWGDWQLGQCSVSCGGGSRTDERIKTVAETNGGVCTGDSHRTESCNPGGCPGNMKYYMIKVSK